MFVKIYFDYNENHQRIKHFYCQIAYIRYSFSRAHLKNSAKYTYSKGEKLLTSSISPSKKVYALGDSLYD